MFTKIKTTLMTIALSLSFAGLLSLGTAAALTAPAHFADFKQDACNGLSQLDSAQSCGKGEAKVTNIVASIVDVLSIIVGAVAVIFIIVAGFKYITSAGDAAKVGAAKSTLIFALVGLFVVAIAQLLVKLVLTAAEKNT